jgi:hypothetical protein
LDRQVAHLVRPRGGEHQRLSVGLNKMEDA